MNEHERDSQESTTIARGGVASSNATQLDHPFSEVLLIEDDPAHARLIQRALRGLVANVTHVSLGNDAIEPICSGVPDLILCDLNLPDTTAIELLGDLKSLRPLVPMVVLTSSNDLESAVSAMKAGAADYMVKQFSEDLPQRFRLLFERLAQRQRELWREQELLAERRAFSAATEAARDGVAILDSSGMVKFGNDAFKNFIRLLAPNLTDNIDSHAMRFSLVDALAAENYPVASAFHEQLERPGSEVMWSSELQLKPPLPVDEKGPSMLFFELTLSSVRTNGDSSSFLANHSLPRIRDYIVWVRDITRRKDEEKFQRELLSTTSHDLKGPLGAIISSSELLSEGPDLENTKVQDLITRIASCARGCITLIDELLSARRIQDGMLVIKPMREHANEVLEDIVLDFLPIAKSKSIELYARPVPEDLEIFADRIGLRRVLSNFVSNALKFTPRGGRVVLDAERHQNEVQILVSDSGPGIEAKDRHLLFEKYGRLDKDRGVEGTGLGLYVSKNIVTAHGGRIEVQSELGVGTTFVVTFPDPK